MKINLGRKRILARMLKIIASRAPDFVVGDPSDPYLRRWYLTPKSLRWLGAIYLHQFCRDDDDVPHDHPYLWNVSWVLQIGYFEDQFNAFARSLRSNRWFIPDFNHHLERKWREEGAVVARWGWTGHRVKLKRFKVVQATLGTNVISNEGNELIERIPRPITLFFCGPRVREWGFYCPQGWKPWRDYIVPTSYGNRIGKGCGE